MTNFLKYKNLIDESINQLDQFEEAFNQLKKSHSQDELEEKSNNLLDSISSFILELLQESRLINGEENTNKCSLLKVLAIRAVCLIDWNLNELEKEIPFVELCDLMEFLIFLANLHQDCTKSKAYKLKKLSSLDLINLEKHQIFVLQFYLRWNLRLKLSSKNHYCSKVKNKKLSLINTKETIDYLDFFFKYLNNNDLYKPVSSCFIIQNDRLKNNVYNFEIHWNNVIKYDKNEIRNIINYDLGMYFFQQEEYEEAFFYFHSVKDYKNKQMDVGYKVNELDSYANELESYLIACKSMLNLDIDDDSCTTTIISNNSNFYEEDINSKQVLTKMVLIENCIKNNLKNVFTKIPEESFLVLVQKMNNKNIDKDLKKKFQQFMELIMDAKEKEHEIENDDDEHQFQDDEEDFDDEEDEDQVNFDNEDEEFYQHDTCQENFHQHETCCSDHSLKLPKEELRPINFFHQMESTNQAPKTAAQRKKEKRKLKKKLKKLQKEENNDRLSTTASTTSTNTTTTTSTVNVNEIINQKGKDLKLIRKKLNKEAREQAEKELEKQLQKIVNSSKKNSQSQNQKIQDKSSKKKKAKKNNNQKSLINQLKQENKFESTIKTLNEEYKQSEKKEENPKSLGDLDDFSEPETKKLNDLDNFEPVRINSKIKLDSLDDFSVNKSKFDKLNVLDDFDDVTNDETNFQKLVIPDEIFPRVMGTKNSNITLIEKITGAKLSLDKYTVEINADSMENLEFALELLHTLINDPQASLTYLLPVETTEKKEFKPIKNESKTKTSYKVSRQNIVSQTIPSKSKDPISVPSYKPKNFAEAVAKKPTSNQVKAFSSQVTNNKVKTSSVTQPISASSICLPVSAVSTLKTEKISQKLEDLNIEVDKKIVPLSTPMYNSQSLCSLSSSTCSSSSPKLEQKKESVFDAISQLWSFSDNDLLERLSPFVSTSSINIDKINTANISSNMTVSKPIGYERNGKLQQISCIEKKCESMDQIGSQLTSGESIRKPLSFGFQAPTQSNQWLNYNAYYQQEATMPPINPNYIYHNYGLASYGFINGNQNIQMAQQIQPNMIMQSTIGNIFPQQQYRY